MILKNYTAGITTSLEQGFYRYEDFDDVVFTSLAGEDALLANYDPRSKIIRPSALMKEGDSSY